MANTTSELVSSAVVGKLKPLAAWAKTLTFDNDKEFASYGRIDEELQSTAFFIMPFHSWERGGIENLNRLRRKFILKK